MAWSADGRYLAFSYSPDDRIERDISYLDMNTRKIEPLCNSPAMERAPSFSPDGRWIAYTSDQSGKREVHVRSFPDGKQTRQISFGGGDWPKWAPAPSAGEPALFTLYYRTPGALQSIQIDPRDGSTSDRPKQVYGRNFGQSDANLIDYEVAPDGRLLIIEPSERGPKVSEVRMVLNWHRLLE
jgi:hypothetical protein